MVLYGALSQTRHASGVGLEMHECVPCASTICFVCTRCMVAFIVAQVMLLPTMPSPELLHTTTQQTTAAT